MEKKKRTKKLREKFNPLEFAVVVKAHGGYLTFSVPDFHYLKVIDMPKGQMSPDYLREVTRAVAQCWLKTQENLARLNEYNVKHPSPTLIKDIFRKRQSKRIGVSRAAAILGCSEQTVRRKADSGKLKCQRTHKGTRYFLESEILRNLCI
jgi:hypothetical protein